MRFHLGTFTPPANATDEQLDEWAIRLSDEIAERLKKPPTEQSEPVEGSRRVADKEGLAEAIARVEAVETSEDGTERDPESEDPV